MITIEGLSKTYAGTGRPALNDIALQIPKGAIYGILGRSGAGKSTPHPLSQFTGAAHLGPHSGERTGYYPVEQGGAAGLSPAHRDDFPALQSATCPHRR